jgi:transposase
MHSKQLPRRRHSVDLKSKVLAACNEPGASVAAVALAHDLNANLVHKWRRGRGAEARMAVAATGATGATTAEFVALSLLPAPTPTPTVTVEKIHIDLKRGATTVSVSWPVMAAADCAGWLRELLR